MKLFLRLSRLTCVVAVSFATAFLLMHFGRRTPIFKEHLYRQLVEGNADQKLRAASILAVVGGEKQLLRGLQVEEPAVHDIARRALEHLWFHACGEDAYRVMESAYEAEERKEHESALGLLDGLVARYPAYAEAWNRRAAVLWQLGDYPRSMEDCERALRLNPNHYGAWQGLGVCQLELGKVEEACRSLRAALRITPHDEPTLRSLQQCERLQHSHASKHRAERPADLL